MIRNEGICGIPLNLNLSNVLRNSSRLSLNINLYTIHLPKTASVQSTVWRIFEPFQNKSFNVKGYIYKGLPMHIGRTNAAFAMQFFASFSFSKTTYPEPTLQFFRVLCIFRSQSFMVWEQQNLPSFISKATKATKAKTKTLPLTGNNLNLIEYSALEDEVSI
ncbi:hypothetical protein RIR_jg3956.t1 [Rhizophagus irregularis DAOM 181602=DAOM 197198]|nr:hypothetical protein RIR_jg3956.t1 [Rhizophagus irregularis DAOM 181602=DAOM 197198]